MLFQLISTLLCFKTPLELFRSDPIINIDWCSQYYWSYAARKLFENSHRIWGFDPYYMAGYPLDFIFNSSLPVQLSNILFKALPLGLVIKWFFFVSFLAAPLNFYFAARNLGLSQGASLASSALGISYFWLGENALFGNWGMLSGAFLLNFFMLIAGMLFRYLVRGDRKSYGWFAILLALSVLIHKTCIVLVGLPCAVILLVFAPRMNSKAWVSVFSAAIFAFLVNSFWLLPMFHFLPNKIEDPNTTFFQNLDWLRWITDFIPYAYPGVALGRLAILLPAIYGITAMSKKSEESDLFKFTVISAAAFFLFIYFGSHSELLRNLQPYRYLTALFFLLAPAAGFGLEHRRARLTQTRPKLAKGLPVYFLVLLLGLQFVPSFRIFSIVAPLSSQWPGKVQSLRTWLETNTDQSGRVMIEDINKWEGKSAPYGPSRFVGLLPSLMPRYLIGGPLPNAFIKHHYASFHDGLFLNRPINEYNDNELFEKIDLYNIRWAIAWSDASKSRLEKFGYARKAAQFEDLEVFEIAGSADWFMVGKGTLLADYDKIELKDLKPENGKIILKMHWLDGFKPKPECELFRYYAAGDPIGFLGLKNPASEVVLEYER